MKHSSERGVSLVEILLVIAILSVLSVMTLQTYKKLDSTKALDTDALRVLLELQEARSLTTSSKNAQQYGVHLATTSVTIFQGTSFVSGNAGNITTTLNHAVTISSSTLSGGGADVIFQRLTGKTAQSGTVTVSLSASSSVKKVIQLYRTGLSEIQ